MTPAVLSALEGLTKEELVELIKMRDCPPSSRDIAEARRRCAIEKAKQELSAASKAMWDTLNQGETAFIEARGRYFVAHAKLVSLMRSSASLPTVRPSY